MLDKNARVFNYGFYYTQDDRLVNNQLANNIVVNF